MMDPLKYIETIVLEIVDRSRFWRDQRKKKFNIARFNVREAAYAFLRQYNGEAFIKAQKVWYNNQELHLCVRDLIYGKNSGIAKTSVGFIYRKLMFSEIKWPVITINQINRVRWTSNDEKLVSKSHFNGDYSSINVDERRMVPCIACHDVDNDQSLAGNSTRENITTKFGQNCRLHQSVTGLQKLINENDESLMVGHDTDHENHFRSSIYIHVNQIKIS